MLVNVSLLKVHPYTVKVILMKEYEVDFHSERREIISELSLELHFSLFI